MCITEQKNVPIPKQMLPYSRTNTFISHHISSSYPKYVSNPSQIIVNNTKNQSPKNVYLKIKAPMNVGGLNFEMTQIK